MRAGVSLSALGIGALLLIIVIGMTSYIAGELEKAGIPFPAQLKSLLNTAIAFAPLIVIVVFAGVIIVSLLSLFGGFAGGGRGRR